MRETKIPVLDLTPEIESLWDELMAAVQGVLKSGQFIMGPNVQAFEREVADYRQVKHAIAVNSGTGALVTGLRAASTGTTVHYPVPIHGLPVNQSAPEPSPLRMAEQLAGEVLRLPLWPEILRQCSLRYPGASARTSMVVGDHARWCNLIEGEGNLAKGVR